MTRYHINKHGVPAPCKAQKGNCPYGGNESHYDNLEDAQKAAAEKLESEYGIFKELKYNYDSSLKEKYPNLNDYQLEKVQEYYDKELEIQKEVTDLVNSSPEYMGTDEYFERVQRVRAEALKKYELGREMNEILEGQYQEEIKEDLSNKIKENVGESPNTRKEGVYHASPEISEETFEEDVGEVFTSYSGKSMDTVKREIKELQEKRGNISFNEAAHEYWAKLERRTDKPIVSLDFETANPTNDNGLEYDNGQLTYIIDVGAIKTYPDGRQERLEFYAGVPESFAKTHGTGFQDLHNIAPETIKGLPELTGSENGKKLADFLDGSVIMAHNAAFEIKQLTNSIPGIRKKINSGEIEVLDTWKFTKYLVPETPRNSNKNLVEAAGLEYKNAHRGMADAEMTMNAFNIIKERQRSKYE